MDLKAIKPALMNLLKEKHDRLKAKGIVKIITKSNGSWNT